MTNAVIASPAAAPALSARLSQLRGLDYSLLQQCMTACPAGDNYAELFEHARAEADRTEAA